MHAYMHIYANKTLHIFCILNAYMRIFRARTKYFMYLKAIDNSYKYSKRSAFMVKMHKWNSIKQPLCIIIQQK